MNQVKHRLVRSYDRFLRNGEFIDVIINSSNERKYPGHKIILANESKWFKDYFIANKSDDPVQVVNLPYDPENSFDFLIQFVYTERLTLSVQNISNILAVSQYYKFNKLHMIASRFLNNILCVENSVFLCTNLIKNELYAYAVLIAPIFAQEFAKIQKKVHSELTLADIIECCNAQVFSEVLKQNSLDFVTRLEKVQYIDDFVDIKKIENLQDREFLASAIDWQQEDSYKIYLACKCDWIPSKIQRSLLCKVFDARRSTINNFKKETHHCPKTTGVWSPLSWLTAISNGDICDKPPTVDLLEFFGTHGIGQKIYNPLKYTLLQISSSELLDDDYSASKLIAGKSYFCSAVFDEIPYLEFDFGPHAGIITSEFGISCESSIDSEHTKVVPSKLLVKAYIDSNDNCLYEKVFRYSKQEIENNVKTFPLVCDVPIRKLHISIPEKSKFGYDVLRITKLRILCSFALA